MRLRDVALTTILVVTCVGLVVASALTDLRSPERTATLGAALADDPAVQDAVAGAVVDALIADVTRRSPLLTALVTPLRGALTTAVDAAIDTPAGRTLLASALTDAVRQLTFPGPVVIDLRSAVLAIADDAPPPLDGLARIAVEQGAVGLLVLGGEDDDAAGADGPDGTVSAVAVPSEDELRRVAGLPSRVTLGLLALALVATLVLLVGRDGSRRPVRIAVASAVLMAIGGVTLLVLGSAVEALTSDAVAPLTAGTAFATALPVLLDGIVGLLGRTAALARGLTAVGGIGLVAACVTIALRSRRDGAAPHASVGA